MRFFQIIIFTLVLLTSCSKSNDDYTIDNQKVEVVIGASRTITTRTSIGDDMESVGWCSGDQIALWADGVSNSNSNLVGEMFQLKYFGSTYDIAKFSSIISSMDDTQQYTYRGFYPYSEESINEKSVSYNIPSTQSGEYDGEYDYRVAEGVTAPALSGLVDDGYELSFQSLTHALKITIPSGYNKLGAAINKLRLTFPTNVVGDASYDMSTMSGTTSPSESSVTLNLEDNPIIEGDVVWMFIHPCSNVTGDILVRGYSVDGDISCDYTITIENHTFAAGHITPVNTQIEEALPLTTIQIEITGNNLGEDLTQIHFSAPDGAIFNESDSNTVTIENDGSGVYKVSYIAELYGDKFDGNSIAIQYESESALISGDDILVSTITEDVTNTVSCVVPYLFEEDFSGVSTFSYKDAEGFDSSAGVGKNITLTDYGLTGWTADRAGASAGLSMRTTCRIEGGANVQAVYQGRIDTAPLTGIKEGKTVNINVAYTCSGGENEYSGSKDGSPMYYHGWTTETGELSASSGSKANGSYTIFGKEYTYEIYDNTPGSCIENTVGSRMSQGTSGSFSSVLAASKSFDISSADNTVRISWCADVERVCEFAQGGDYYLFIDNLKVKITK